MPNDHREAAGEIDDPCTDGTGYTSHDFIGEKCIRCGKTELVLLRERLAARERELAEANRQLAEARVSISNFRAVIRIQETNAPFDINDDQTTDLAIRLAEADAQLAESHQELERSEIRRAFIEKCFDEREAALGKAYSERDAANRRIEELEKARSKGWSVRDLKDALKKAGKSKGDGEGGGEADGEGNDGPQTGEACECCGSSPAPMRMCAKCAVVPAKALETVGIKSAMELMNRKPSKPQLEMLIWEHKYVKQPPSQTVEEEAEWEARYEALQKIVNKAAA